MPDRISNPPSENRTVTWYHQELFSSYHSLLDHLATIPRDAQDSTWVFRGQLADYPLATSLERHCQTKSRIDWKRAQDIEDIIVREFRRSYQAEDRLEVMNDTLYCLSLLQHHGAPTRLLDFSYSEYVALYFGLREAYESITYHHKGQVRFALWCIDVRDISRRARALYAASADFMSAYNARADLNNRNDKSFSGLYLEDRYDLVMSENPARIHQRLHLQQGLFLCPGRVTKPFMENLRSLYTPMTTTRVRELVCSITPDKLYEAFEHLMRMNITEETLFPGLDGRARSTRYQLWFYNRLSEAIRKDGGSTR
jgi:hypothetical protein